MPLIMAYNIDSSKGTEQIMKEVHKNDYLQEPLSGKEERKAERCGREG